MQVCWLRYRDYSHTHTHTVLNHRRRFSDGSVVQLSVFSYKFKMLFISTQSKWKVFKKLQKVQFSTCKSVKTKNLNKREFHFLFFRELSCSLKGQRSEVTAAAGGALEVNTFLLFPIKTGDSSMWQVPACAVYAELGGP